MLTERSVELPWLISRIGRPRRLLDIGSADAVYLGLLYELCRDLCLCDTREIETKVPCVTFQGSASKMPDSWKGHFDLVTCISTLDHIGLDAYGNQEESDLLNATLDELERVTIKGGRLLLSVPYGVDQVTTHPGGGQRIFGKSALAAMFRGRPWEAFSVFVWKLQGNHYAPSTLDEAADANYAEWRAGACVAMEMRRL